MCSEFYFYRKTVCPEKCSHYFHSKGVAGYKEPQNGTLVYHGTIEGAVDYLKNRLPVNRDYRESRFD